MPGADGPKRSGKEDEKKPVCDSRRKRMNAEWKLFCFGSEAEGKTRR